MKKVLAEFRRFSRRLSAAKQIRQISGDIEKAKIGTEEGLPLRVAFRVAGGIGDHIVAARFVRDLLAAAGPFGVDVFSPKGEAVAWIFEGLEAPVRCFNERFLWERLQPSYVVSLYVTQFVIVHADTADLAHLAERAPKLFEICTRLEAFRPRIETCIKHHPMLDGHLARMAGFMGLGRRDFLQGMAGIPYGGDTLPLQVDPGALEKFGLAGKPYITVHNGFDAEFGKASPNSTKVYPRFGDVVSRVKAMFPDLRVVQVGTVTSKAIPSADINLIGATTIQELAAIIRNSWLNLDNESGIVHLASCLGVRSCVVFGPTSLDYYAYPQNINLAPPVCGECWWIREDWMSRCARGHEQPPCMSQQSPETVFAALREPIAALYGKEGRAPVEAASAAAGTAATRRVVDGVVA